MSTTGLDAATLARSLRRMAGDGSVEWVMEPIQSSVLRDIADMLDENKKLREEIAKARDPQRIGGQADPESFVYAIEQLREFRWQHATNDEDAIPYINKVAKAHERDNAKLKKLAQRMWRLERFGCYGCRRECDAESCYASECKEAIEIEQEMRELGVEVGGEQRT